MYEQKKKMFDENVRRCADRIVSIYQPHLRPIVRGKAKAKVEFGAKIGTSIVNGYLRRPSQLGRLQRIVRPRHAIGTL